MDVRLMHPVADANPSPKDPIAAADLLADLELDILLDHVGGDDHDVRHALRAALLHPVTDAEVISYRHEVLRDLAAQPDLADEIYDLTAQARDADHSVYSSIFARRPERFLDRSLAVLALLADVLERLNTLARIHASRCTSPGLRDFLARIERDLDPAYLNEVREHIDRLHLRKGIVFSARVSPGGLVAAPTLRRPRPENKHLLSRNPLHRPTLAWTVPDRDESGHRALSDLRDRILADVARAVDESVRHIVRFFLVLRHELAFYRGCTTLEFQLRELDAPTCLPATATTHDPLIVTGLYDPCLALRTEQVPNLNDVDSHGAPALVITGANHGGKTTLLRAIGQLHLMAQAGVPVAARAATVPLAQGVYTHWAREEDDTLTRGKLDDELARMSDLVDILEPGALLLSNESFSSTNEAEGSHIALDTTRALIAVGVRVVAVTHLYDFAHQLDVGADPDTALYRAPRQTSTSAYVLEPGPPEPTSYGPDLYRSVFDDRGPGKAP